MSASKHEEASEGAFTARASKLPAIHEIFSSGHELGGIPVLRYEPARNYVAYLRRVAFAAPDPEVMGMLTTLKSRGFKLAVVTNANDLDTAPWAEHELAAFFDVFVASHEVGMLKPDRRIYKLACARLGIAPSSGLFVGDGGSNELQGAADAGIEALWCSWFLDRWPVGVRPGRFPGGEWRDGPTDGVVPF